MSLFNRTFTADEIREIRGLVQFGTPRITVARLYGCSRVTIDRIVQRVTYYNVPDDDAPPAKVRSPHLAPKVAPSAAHADDLAKRLIDMGLAHGPRADGPPPPPSDPLEDLL
jgi:hypothetical protein